MGKKKKKPKLYRPERDPLRDILPRDRVELGPLNMWAIFGLPKAQDVFGGEDDEENRKRFFLLVEAHHLAWSRYLRYVRLPEDKHVKSLVNKKSLRLAARSVEKLQKSLGIVLIDTEKKGYSRRWDDFVIKMGRFIFWSARYPPEEAQVPPLWKGIFIKGDKKSKKTKKKRKRPSLFALARRMP